MHYSVSRLSGGTAIIHAIVLVQEPHALHCSCWWNCCSAANFAVVFVAFRVSAQSESENSTVYSVLLLYW